MGRGNAVTVRHVHTFKDRHGRTRSYLRIPGRNAVALPGEPGSPAWLRAYHEATDDLPSRDAKAKPFSMNDLALRYWQTTGFKAKSDRTRYVERQQIERFLTEHGDRSARAVQTRHLDAIFAKMAERPAAAMDLRKRLRHLFKLAIKLGWRGDNPIDATDTFKLGTHHTWTDEEIARFQARWPRGTARRTAFDLLLYTGQRSGDVRQMTWGDVANGRLRVIAQDKTGQAVSVRLHTDLAATLAEHPREGVVILVTAFGKAFTEAGFGGWMAESIALAGLPERCVTHGLRKAAMRRLAEAGATDAEIMSISGHRTRKEVSRYTDAANRAHMADRGMRKVERARRANTASQTVSQTET